jgi:hypothetical protein
MANIFQSVPHDVLNHVMAPFLDANDRTTFNQVNHPFERVYKKFPTDYAIKKHLIVMKNKYNRMCKRHEELLEALTAADVNLGHARQDAKKEVRRIRRHGRDKCSDWEEEVVRDAVSEVLAARKVAKAAAAEVAHVYFKIYSLLEDPLFVPALKYDTRARSCVSETLERLYEDSESLEQTSHDMKENLRTRCAEVQAYITTIPFVREIGTK